jgi:hypothetical protein
MSPMKRYAKKQANANKRRRGWPSDATSKPKVTVQVVKTGIMRRLEIADPVQAGERGRVHHATPLHAPP